MPSLIWPCALLHLHGLDGGSAHIAGVLDLLHEFGEREEDGASVPVWDSTLQSFELVPEADRASLLHELREAGVYDDAFPWVLARALSNYADVPGSWIFGGWKGREPILAPDAAGNFLAEVVAAAWHGQSEIATRAKMLYFRGYLQAGKMHFAPQITWINLLPRYPSGLSPEQRQQVESSARATFQALWATPEDHAANTRDWAQAFWRQNWSLYECASDAPTLPSPESDATDVPPWQPVRERLLDEMERLGGRFLDAHRAADPDLFAPERNEVLTGMTHRQIRAVSMMIMSPTLWAYEFGAGVVRGLVEARIVQKWLIRENDPALYSRFKDYGRGRLKLQVLHLREYRDGLDSPPDSLNDVIEDMEAYLNRDIWEEFQDISVEGNFAKIDTRRMALAVGLESDYRLVFAPMSADVHGEWMSLERYALTVCANPLHRGHRIPCEPGPFPIGPELVDLAMRILGDMVTDYTDAINAPPASDRT